MRSRVTFCTVFASVPVDFKPTETEPNRNFNDLVPELLIRFGLISKVKTEPDHCETYAEQESRKK